MNEHPSQEFDTGYEQQPRLSPRIWVGSLADYNAGRLHGDWFDAAVPDKQLHAEIQAMLDASTEDVAEEYGIFDYDEFGTYKPGEYEDLAVVAAIARGIHEHGPAFSAWATLHDTDMLTAFTDYYVGEHDSPADWARDLLCESDIDARLDQALPDSLRPFVHFDYDAFARDAQLSGEIAVEAAPGGRVWVFLAP